jgi:hypothetical protein
MLISLLIVFKINQVLRIDPYILSELEKIVKSF